MTARGELLDVALGLAAREWPVFPLRPGTKRPALHGHTSCRGIGPCSSGHRGWEQRATTDPTRIRAAWSAGTFNIGVATGPAGLLVIDLDTAKPDEQPPARWAAAGDGAGVLAALLAEMGEVLPATYEVVTPSGGRHLYFAVPGGLELRNTAGELGHGLGWKIDTRAHGGYVVAAGSRMPVGIYQPDGAQDPAPLPSWLADRLAPPLPPAMPAGPIRTGTGRRDRYLDVALRAETARVAEASASQRNCCLYVAAVALGQLVAGGSLDEGEARATLRSASAGHVALGAYSAYQAKQTITSGLLAGAKRPRRIEDAA